MKETDKQTPALSMRTYRIRVMIVPPNYEIELGVSKIRYEVRTIQGYTFKDAKRRAGID